jgi:hypothetical protein
MSKLITKLSQDNLNGSLDEVKMIMVAKIFPMVRGEVEVPGTWQIFTEKLHLTWDNYFLGCKIFDWIDKEGFDATMTCHCDQLPKIIPSKYLHKKKNSLKTKSCMVKSML